jgi:amino acid transporter
MSTQSSTDRQQIKLEKAFKPHWVWAIAFGSAIGWGSFVLPATWMSQGGPFGMIIGFSIGALLMCTIGISTGYLIRAFPVTGGAFTYAYLCFGRNHAYVCGWFLILGYAAIVALNATALGLMIKFLVPNVMETGFLYSVAGWDVYIVQIIVVTAVLIAAAWLNIHGAVASGEIQFWFVAILLGGAWALFFGMSFSPSTSFSNIMPAFNPKVGMWSSILGFVAISPWAFIGFDSIPQTAEEFNFSHNRATMLILIALGVAAVHYAVMMIATGLAMPWSDLVAKNAEWGTGLAIENTLGAWGLAILVLALTMGIFTGLIGFYIATSRLMYAMARAKALPPIFARLHSKHHTPYGGIVFCCLLCMLSPWFGRSVLLWIVSMSAVGVSIAFLYYGLVAYKLFRWSHASPDTDFSQEVAPIKKLVALLATLFSLCILALLIIPGTASSLTVPSWIALAFWVVLGFMFYVVYGNAYRKASKEELDQLILGKQVSTNEPEYERSSDLTG